MAATDYAITFACYNQVAYTKACVESMVRHGVDLGRVVAVDNGSGDETREYLSSLPLGGRVLNRVNLGCGVAWNQGQRPSFLGGDRDGISSAGVSLRANLGGWAIGEFALSRPFQRERDGWVFQFNLSPGW